MLIYDMGGDISFQHLNLLWRWLIVSSFLQLWYIDRTVSELWLFFCSSTISSGYTWSKTETAFSKLVTSASSCFSPPPIVAHRQTGNRLYLRLEVMQYFKLSSGWAYYNCTSVCVPVCLCVHVSLFVSHRSVRQVLDSSVRFIWIDR